MEQREPSSSTRSPASRDTPRLLCTSTSRAEVEDARFHVTQFRGFEKFCEGRPFTEMPSLMARICGICPVSHLIASAKACDALLAVRIPPTAEKLRRIFNMAQVVQSHALSVFHLSSPDLLLGMDADPAKSNLLGVFGKETQQLARDGIRLRQFGQQIIERLGGKRIHPAWVVPGGVSEPLSRADRDAILATIPEALAIARRTLSGSRGPPRVPRGDQHLRQFPHALHGHGEAGRRPDFLRWQVRIGDAAGKLIADGLDPTRYFDYIGEKVEPWSYLKSAYYKPKGYPRRHVPRGTIGPPECGGPLRHAPRRPGTGRVPGIAARGRAQFFPLSSRALDRDSLLRGAHGAAVD